MSVTVEGLTKRYGDLVAVSGLDLQIPEGELFALLGPNGAGKTTTIEVIEGFRRPDSGTVRVLGLDPRRQARALRPQMGLMLQEGGLYQQMRVAEVIHLFAAYYPHPSEPDGLLDELGLSSLRARKVRALSGGERQRLNLATALVGDPKVLFLDEPTSGMDPEVRQVTWDRLIAMRTAGTTVMFTTHLTEEAERYADRVGVMGRGRLIATGSPAELTAGMPVTFSTDRPLDLESFRRRTSVTASEVSPRRYRTDRPHSPSLVELVNQAVAAQGASIVELRSGSLEEFMRRASEQGGL